MRNLFTTSALCLALISAGLTSAFAADTPTDLPAPLALAQHAGMHIVRSFPAESGLTGWVLMHDNQYSIVYTTPDHKSLLAGALVDASGRNMTAIYGNQYVPKPDYAALMPRVEGAAAITTGATGNAVKSTIYVMFDPNCIFCHLAWEAFKPYEAVGLQIKWIPVAFLKPTSAGISAAMLASKDPSAAFVKNETGFVDSTETGGLAPLGTVPGDIISKIKSNNDLLTALGSHGTPTIVYKDEHGKVQVKDGMPRLSELPGITGLPEQPEKDPALARLR